MRMRIFSPGISHLYLHPKKYGLQLPTYFPSGGKGLGWGVGGLGYHSAAVVLKVWPLV